jgi:ABC-type branched-subunit amino acid transport system permease subunit
MSSKSVRNGLSTGLTFAIVILFLILTGFSVTGSGIIAKFLGNAPDGNQMPSTTYLVILMALLGIWNGARASRPSAEKESLQSVLANSLVAGLFVGVMLGGVGLIFGSLLNKGIDPRAYLNMLSPDSMKLFLFNQPAVSAVFLHLVIMLASSVAGGLLAFFSRKGSIRQTVGNSISSFIQTVSSLPLVTAIRRFPFTIYIIYALVAMALFFLPRQMGSYWNYIIGTVGIYVIMGLGLNIIVGLAGQLVLGYVAFFAIGAYSVALLTAAQPHNLQWNFWIVLVIGVTLAGLTGILLGLPILRLRGDYLAIVTLGFGEIIRIMLRSDLLTPLTAGPKGVRAIAGPTLFGQPFSSDVDFFYLIMLAVILVIFITNRLQNSRPGRAWVAIREDEIAARATGINTFQSKLLALAIGAAFAGLGGVLFASRNQFTGPEDHTLMVSINVLALLIVGGMGSIPGIILGAFALKGLPEILRELENYRLLFFGGLLVVMMILRPEGLWPSSRPKLEQSDSQAPNNTMSISKSPAEIEEA